MTYRAAAKIIIYVRNQKLKYGSWVIDVYLLKIRAQRRDRLGVHEVVFGGLHVACTLPGMPRCSLVLEVRRLECDSRNDCGLFRWAGDVVGCERGGYGTRRLRSSAALRRKAIASAGRRFGCYRDEVGLGESRSGGAVGSGQSQSGGDEQRQRLIYEKGEHSFSFGLELRVGVLEVLVGLE